MKPNRLPYSRYLLSTSFIVMLLVSVFVISSMVNFAGAEINTKGTYFEIVPTHSNAANGGSFTIDINVIGAPANSHDWQLTLSWNATLLNATAVGAGDLTPATSVFKPPLPANESITIGQSMLGSANFSGNVRLCNVTFLVEAVGSCVLNLTDTLLINLDGVKTYYPNNDGFFRENSELVDDVAVTNVTTSATSVAPGDTVTINVTVKNEGNYTQTFTVKVYADVVTHNASDLDQVMVGDEIIIDTYTVTGLAPGATNTTIVNWTPDATVKAETYNISAEVIKPEDDDPHDNIFIDCSVKINVLHDLKMVSITVPSSVWRRGIAVIGFTVLNQGNQTETNFNITIKANGTFVGTITIASLAGCSGASNTSSFNWDTTAWSKGTYTINVSAPDLGERAVDLADNSLTATIEIKGVYDRVVVSVATATPGGYPNNFWTSQNASVRVTVKNAGTEVDTFPVILYADQFVANGNCVVYGTLLGGQSLTVTNGIGTVTLPPFTNNTITLTLTWFTKQYPAGTLITWKKCDNTTTQFIVYSGVYAGSYSTVVFLPIGPTEQPKDVANNRGEGLPIIVDQIPADLNLNGGVTAADGIIYGKLLNENRPC